MRLDNPKGCGVVLICKINSKRLTVTVPVCIITPTEIPPQNYYLDIHRVGIGEGEISILI